MKATMEGLKLMSTQESLAKKILSKYTRQTDPESLDRAYRFGLETLNKDPTIPREAMFRWSVSWPTSVSSIAQPQPTRRRKRFTTTALPMK